MKSGGGALIKGFGQNIYPWKNYNENAKLNKFGDGLHGNLGNLENCDQCGQSFDKVS